MKLVSWNVNGLRAIAGKGFDEIFKSIDADIMGLQEIKLQAGQLDLEFDGYSSFYNYAERKGYSGTAIYSRIPALKATNGIGDSNFDVEGRAITLDMGDFYFVTLYVPNAQPELARIEYRLAWEDALADYVSRLDKEKPVIICGDLNVAHQPIDLANPQSNHHNPGFSDEERGAFTKLLSSGFIDTFRHLHPDAEGAYSWWSYRFNARSRNSGWRIDYFLISERLKDKLVSAEIHSDIMGSDHCPVSITINI